MAASKKSPSGSGSRTGGHDGVPDLSIAMQAGAPGEVITARIAGTLRDLSLDVSPRSTDEAKALRHMAKAINLALQGDFIETRLEPVYEVARVRKGTVQILHREYIGLGDGFLASIGKVAKSFVLTLQGADPASALRADQGSPAGGPVKGLINLLARKLDLVQEYEDMVPTFVEQTLDRLEAVRMVCNWRRDEWNIDTTTIGLDVIMKPEPPPSTDPADRERPQKERRRSQRKKR